MMQSGLLVTDIFLEFSDTYSLTILSSLKSLTLKKHLSKLYKQQKTELSSAILKIIGKCFNIGIYNPIFKSFIMENIQKSNSTENPHVLVT